MWMAEDKEALLQCCSCKSLLREPLLLRCLHNICSRCWANVCSVNEGSASLVCPACNQEIGADIKQENLFVAGQVGELEKLRNAGRCGICIRNSQIDKTADDWCSKCQMSMCLRCSSEHYLTYRDHSLLSLAEACSIKDLFEESPHKCCRHGEMYDLMCWTCKTPTCTSCAEGCYQNKHDVEILNTQRTWDHFERIKKYICFIQAGLISKREVLQRCKNVTSELDAAETKDMNELQMNKRAAAESLDRAYKAAEVALKEHYDKLREKALELKRSVEMMDVRAGHAAEYSGCLMASDDKIGLLHQESMLLSGLQALVKELDEIRSPQDATKLVAIVGTMPENLDCYTSAWIGMPTLMTDDLCCTDELIAQLEMDMKECLQFVDRRQSQQDENRSSDLAHKVPDLGPAPSVFGTPVKCYDVAVSADGCRLLLAADEHGLLEYDVSGAELSRWRPAEKIAWGLDGWVMAVEALDDGRVAVCLHYSECVVLLTRRRSWQKGSPWLEDKRVTGLQIRPWHLSVHGDLVAVAGSAQKDEEKKLVGRSLLLLSLCCGRVLSRQERMYGIGGVVVTAQAVLTASYEREREKLSDERLEGCVVEAYSHDGQLLWKVEQGKDSVWDMCLSGNVLYMAVQGSSDSRVTAVRVEDGRVIKDVLTSSSHGIAKPGSLSVSRRGQQTVTAVLGDDWWTVQVYRAKGGQ